MLPKKSILILALCIFQLIGNSQSVTPIECGTFPVDITSEVQPTLDLDPQNPFDSKVQWFSFTALKSFCEVKTYPLNFNLFNFDTKLYIFEDNSPTITPLYFDDNANPEFLGHALIEAQLEIGQEYLIAVAGSNNEEGQCQLQIDGGCYLTSAFDSSIREVNITCDNEATVNFGLKTTPTNDSFFRHGHVSFNNKIYEQAFSNCISFKGNGSQMTLTVDAIGLPAQTNFSYVILSPNSNDFELIQTGSLENESLYNLEITVPTTIFDQTFYFLYEAKPLSLEDVSLVSSGSLDLTLNSDESCVESGSFNNPITLSDGYSSSGGVTDWSTGFYSDNYCGTTDGNSYFARAYSFVGDGLNHIMEIKAGSIVNDCPGCPVEKNGIVTILRWDGSEYICEVNFEASRTELEEYTFESLPGEDYLILFEIRRYVTLFGQLAGNYSFRLKFDEEREAAHQQLFANSLALECGTSLTSNVLPETDLTQNILVTECGSIGFGGNTSAYSFVGTGDDVDFQTIARNGTNGTLSNFVSIFKEEASGYSCIEYRHLGNTDGFTEVNFNSILGATYEIIVESISDMPNEFEAEIYNFSCAGCFAQFGEQGFPNGTSEQTFIEETVIEYPECCLLGWTSNCESYIEQLILSELSLIAQPIDCGIHQIDQSEVNHSDFQELTFNGIDYNEKVMSFEFTGTGSPMDFLVTIDGFQSFTTSRAYITAFNGSEWEILQEAIIGFSEYNAILNDFTNIAGDTYYLVVQTDGFLNEQPSFELTVTDDTNCGICDVVFNNEVSFDNDDDVFQAVLSTSPTCCSEWTEGCQSLYELFFFPNCSILPEISCNDNLEESTVGNPIYSGHFCGETFFDSGSSWYTFTGDGNTMIAEVLNPTDGDEFNTIIHGFRGECPFLECLISDTNGGSDGKGYIEIPTVIGEQYFIAVTGENGEEGDFRLRFYSSDYCNTCFTAFDNQHQYEVSNPIYQQVILDLPSCCGGEWDAECQSAYDLIICGNADEPNNDSGNATSLSNFFTAYESDSHSAALLNTSDEDHYTFNSSNQGELFINLISSLTSIDLNMSLYINGTLLAESATLGQSFEFLSLNVESEFLQQIEIVVWSADGGDYTENECYELFWDWIPVEDPSCFIDVALEDVSFCDPMTNTHQLEIEISSLNVGGNTWVINGSEFPFNNEVEVFVIDNLLSDGSQQNLQISAKENPSCLVVLENFYTAPESCLEIGSDCVMDANADGEIGAADLLFFLSVFGTECE